MKYLYIDTANFIVDRNIDFIMNNIEVEIYDYNINLTFDYFSDIYTSELFNKNLTYLTFHFQILFENCSISSIFTDINILDINVDKINATLTSYDIEQKNIDLYVRNNKLKKIINNIK